MASRSGAITMVLPWSSVTSNRLSMPRRPSPMTLWLMSSRCLVCATATSGRHDLGSEIKETPSRTWKKNFGMRKSFGLSEEAVHRFHLIHDLSSRSRRGRLPRHARTSPVFARCAPATSVPRKLDHRREAAAAWGWQRQSPPGHPPQGAGLRRAPPRKRPTLQRVPVSDIKSQYANVRCFLVPARMRSAAGHHRSPAVRTSARKLPFCLVRRRVHRGSSPS